MAASSSSTSRARPRRSRHTIRAAMENPSSWPRSRCEDLLRSTSVTWWWIGSEIGYDLDVEVFSKLSQYDYGEVHFRLDKATQLRAIVAIHDSRMGPALGGCR